MPQNAILPAHLIPSSPVNLLGESRSALERWFVQSGEKRFRAAQVTRWVHERGVTSFSDMTNISKRLRDRLQAHCELRMPLVADYQQAADGTCKWLFKVGADNCIETVFIPDGARATVCLSSQVGCALNCRFCATAQQGFNRNLSSAEIIGQLWQVRKTLGAQRKITNVVMMGMGEPLLNLDNVAAAMEIMLDDYAYGFARKRVTLSTAGVVPGIYALARRLPAVSLAVSLHAPNDALRDQLIPLNRKYPIDTLLAACRTYAQATGRRHITFEYVMLDGVNDAPAQALQLAQLLADFPAKVNLIPFNPFPNTAYRRSSTDAIERFRNLLQSKGCMVTTRKTRGEDIAAACGQLVGAVTPKSQRVAQRRGIAAAPAACHAAPA